MGMVDDRFMNNDEKLAEILAAVRRIEARLERQPQQAAPAGKSSSSRKADLSRLDVPEVAEDRDLDGQWGDPLVKHDKVKGWDVSYKGTRYSECPADFLESYAGLLDFFAGLNLEKGDEKKARFDKLDASRARGWAARQRAGTMNSMKNNADDLGF